ncbi:MAG TPA: hypothetical protein VMW52_04445, partial [Phycisphaerae bacterium]|nr:hypothetical protein [Phycisphaerae bacterium]
FVDTKTGLTIELGAGECLIVAADFGDARADGGMEWSFEFRAAPNRDDLAVGDIEDIVKGGFEYLWVRSRQKVVADLNMLGLQPVAAYVERFYEAGDFSVLRLGEGEV